MRIVIDTRLKTIELVNPCSILQIVEELKELFPTTWEDFCVVPTGEEHINLISTRYRNPSESLFLKENN